MRSERVRPCLSAVAMLAAWLVAARAQAFCRTTSVASPPDRVPVSCGAEGVPLYHVSQCVPYRLLTKDSPVVPNAVLSGKLAAAFASWTARNATCTPGISTIELAPVSDATIVSYRAGETGRNVVGVAPTWTHPGGADTLALSTLTFSAKTGEIEDVDLEINGEVSWSFEDKPPPGTFDLEAALTHEVGHMLGIGHSTERGATMYPLYEEGSLEQRTLSSDDEAAICAVYPNRGQRLAASGLVPSSACDLAPGAPDANCSDPNITHGCSMSGSASGAGTLGFGVAFAMAVLSAGRRRRSR